MDERSNRDLKDALARGQFSPRKTAFAREILRRRRDYKAKGWWQQHVWLAATAAAFSWGVAILTRFWRQRPGGAPHSPL